MRPRQTSQNFCPDCPGTLSDWWIRSFTSETLPGRRNSRFSNYPHSCRNVTPADFNAAEIQRLVSATLEWQYELNVTSVLSPTVVIDELAGQWALTSSMLAQETVTRHNQEKPLLISVVIEETALRQRRLVNHWIDELTALDVDGFYLVVNGLQIPTHSATNQRLCRHYCICATP